jgi:hypothetical protein
MLVIEEGPSVSVIDGSIVIHTHIKKKKRKKIPRELNLQLLKHIAKIWRSGYIE